jgi:serine/threonine protein kinase
LSKCQSEASSIPICFLQVASALMYIHSFKILHRDLKTQNIFLNRGGIVMLGDFGISKVNHHTETLIVQSVTSAAHVCSTSFWAIFHRSSKTTPLSKKMLCYTQGGGGAVWKLHSVQELLMLSLVLPSFHV